ncbi:hypothetical protein ACFYMW_26300 [Streptomyces sp. NPDC006692]|uniref:hypothetical protein n=1 Tax=unclassified Streptomyces TaxID=2593676 RepID=UPI00341DCD54
MAEVLTADLAQAAVELIISRLDDEYELVYVDHGDRLTDEQVQKLIAGDEEVLDEDWVSENRWRGVNAVLDALLNQDARDFLDEHAALDQLREAIEERDASHPIRDLMRGTGSKLFRYRLEGQGEPGAWKFSDAELTSVARGLAAAAGLDFWENCAALRELVANASYGGDLHVLWRGDIKPVYDAVGRARGSDSAPVITVQWTDPELLVLDRWNGSGHTVRVRGTVNLPFDPDRLCIDAARGPGGCSWTDVVGGGYQPEGGEPEFTHPTT